MENIIEQKLASVVVKSYAGALHPVTNGLVFESTQNLFIKIIVYVGFMEKQHLNLITTVNILAFIEMDCLQERANLSGKMVLCMKANSKEEKYKGKEDIFGTMAANMKEICVIAKETVQEHLKVHRDNLIRVNGKMEKNTVKARCISTLKKQYPIR